MNTPTEIAKLLAECRLACGAEAVARGFPPEAGYDIYYGCYLDALQARSQEQFLYWTYRLDSKYGCDSTVAINPLMELYKACCQIMKNYLDLLKKLDEAHHNNSNQTLIGGNRRLLQRGATKSNL